MLQLNEAKDYPYRITLAQLFFEKHFIDKKVGKLPLNEFFFDKTLLEYVPANMKKDKEVTLSLPLFNRADAASLVTILEQ